MKKKNERRSYKKYEEEHEQQILERYKEDRSNNEKMIKPFSELIAEIFGEDTKVHHLILTVQ
ncbi:MAG: hypothetical protein J6K48_13630 [Lachnospiraceae bacterium]|nr:hypothetical protein [Lachnospiraceae bacterium]